MENKKAQRKPRSGPTSDALKAEILELIGQGQDRIAICKKLDMVKSTYFNYLRDIQADMKDKDVIAEKRAKIVKAGEDIYKMALQDYATMRKFTQRPDGTMDPKRYAGIASQIKVLKETRESMEKTYARFGMIPSERHVVEQVGDVSPAVKIFAVDPSLYNEALNGRKE